MSRSSVIQKIKSRKPDPVELPPVTEEVKGADTELLREFIDKVIAAGAKVEQLDPGSSVESWIEEQTASVNESGTEKDLLVVHGQFGVAENGAVWIIDEDMEERKFPFLCIHLAMTLSKDQIVPDMHAACRRLDLEKTGFGVFIAGPSKTADIEQSLVIGAHGPKQHTILLI